MLAWKIVLLYCCVSKGDWDFHWFDSDSDDYYSDPESLTFTEDPVVPSYTVTKRSASTPSRVSSEKSIELVTTDFTETFRATTSKKTSTTTKLPNGITQKSSDETSHLPVTKSSEDITVFPVTESSEAVTIFPVTESSKGDTVFPVTDSSQQTTVSPVTGSSEVTTVSPVTGSSEVTTVSPVTGSSEVTTVSPVPESSESTSETLPTWAPFTTTTHTTEATTEILMPFIAMYNTSCIALMKFNASTVRKASEPIFVPPPPEAEVKGSCNFDKDVLHIIYPCPDVTPIQVCDLVLVFTAYPPMYYLSQIAINATSGEDITHYSTTIKDMPTESGNSFRCTGEMVYNLSSSDDWVSFTIHEIWVQAFRTDMFDEIGPVTDCSDKIMTVPRILYVVLVVIFVLVIVIVCLFCKRRKQKMANRDYERLRRSPSTASETDDVGDETNGKACVRPWSKQHAITQRRLAEVRRKAYEGETPEERQAPEHIFEGNRTEEDLEKVEIKEES